MMGVVNSTDSAISFDAAILAKIKSGMKLPVNMKVKYAYVNSTGAKQEVRMTRQLLDKDGKVLSSKSAKWVMKVGEKDSLTFSQTVANNFSVGAYKIRIAATDWKTNAPIAENSVSFEVVLK